MEPRVGFVREAARKLVAKHGVRRAPVPVREIAEKEGFTVVDGRMPDRVSGYCRPDSKHIILNGTHHEHRKRFTLAHELGHAVLQHKAMKAMDFSDLDQPARVEIGETEDLEEEAGPLRSQMPDVYDREADEFAGELLIPRAFLKRDWPALQSLQKVSELYNVSLEVASIAYLRVYGGR